MDNLTTSERVAQIHVMIEQLYQSIIPDLQERIGRHSLEHHNAINEVRADLKSVNANILKIVDVEKENLKEIDRRVLKLETERGIAVKVVTPVVAAITSALTAMVLGHR